MERRKQILELIRRFDNDFESSLSELGNEDQITVVRFLKNVIPLFIKQEEGYYEQFYTHYEREILEGLRAKARTLHNLKLTDYLVQESMKLVDLQHELKIEAKSADDQLLTDEEFADYMRKIANLVNRKYQILLISDQSASGAKKTLKHSKSQEVHTGQGDDAPEALGDREEYMTIDECAKFLNTSKVTIHSYKNQGMPFYKIGRTVKFKKSEVLDFMRQNAKPARKK